MQIQVSRRVMYLRDRSVRGTPRKSKQHDRIHTRILPTNASYTVSSARKGSQIMLEFFEESVAWHMINAVETTYNTYIFKSLRQPGVFVRHLSFAFRMSSSSFQGTQTQCFFQYAKACGRGKARCDGLQSKESMRMHMRTDIKGTRN